MKTFLEAAIFKPVHALTRHHGAFIYDDRGLEVVTKVCETLRPYGEAFRNELTYGQPINLKS